MLDIGWVEMMVIIIVMIIVIGPKDLPRVLYAIGQWVARARALARSFQDQLEDMARDTGVNEVREQVQNIRDFRLDREIEKTIDPEGDLKRGIGVTEPPATSERRESPQADMPVTEPARLAAAAQAAEEADFMPPRETDEATEGQALRKRRRKSSKAVRSRAGTARRRASHRHRRLTGRVGTAPSSPRDDGEGA